MGIFDVFKKNLIQSEIEKVALCILLNKSLKFREGEFVKALIMNSQSYVVQDVLFILTINKSYIRSMQNILDEKLIKQLLALETAFLFCCFDKMTGFFESFGINQSEIKNLLETVFDNQIYKQYLTELGEQDLALPKMMDFFEQEFLRVTKLQDDVPVFLGFLTKKTGELQGIDNILSCVIQTFKEMNPHDLTQSYDKE